MGTQQVIFRDLGVMDYKTAWDYQEQLLQENVRKKSLVFSQVPIAIGTGVKNDALTTRPERQSKDSPLTTQHYLLFVEHPPVYTLGKSGNIDNVLLSEQELAEQQIQFFNTTMKVSFHNNS